MIARNKIMNKFKEINKDVARRRYAKGRTVMFFVTDRVVEGSNYLEYHTWDAATNIRFDKLVEAYEREYCRPLGLKLHFFKLED